MAKTAKKQEILRKGFELMYLKGYNATSVQDIVVAAGIPKGSFYHYFRTKENFAVEALTYYTQQVDQNMEAMLNNEKISPIQRVIDFYQARIGFYQAHNCKLGCFAGNLTLEVADTNETLRAHLDDFFINNLRPIVKCLQQAKDTGDLSADYDVEELAEFIVNSYEGALLRMKSTRNLKPLIIFQQMLAQILGTRTK